MNDLSNIIIKKLIIHRVFKRGPNNELINPDYSNNPISLNLAESNVIRERLVSALGKNSKSLLMDLVEKDDNSTVSIVSKLYNCSNDEFTSYSKEITLKLAEAQTYKRISDCALFIITGTVSAQNIPFACIVKSESQSAFRLIEDVRHQKSLELIEDALLGKDQKLYKIGFISNLDKDINEFEILIFDSNLDQFKSSNAAKYFYINFLGCKIKENSAKLTKDFFDETTKFINSIDSNPSTKFNLQNQLNSYLLSEGSLTINSLEFANTVFKDADMIDNYISHLGSQEISTRSIVKNTDLINKKLKKRHLNFSNGIKIIGEQQTIENSLIVLSDENGMVTIKINGNLINQI